jgi:hypothetical protein
MCVTISVRRADEDIGPQADLGTAIELIRSGKRAAAVGTAVHGRRALLIKWGAVADHAGGSTSGCVVRLGFATTADGAEGSGADPRGLQPARAIRRALADAGLKAESVRAVWATFEPLAHPEARSRATDAIALALGRHAPAVAVNLRPKIGDGAISVGMTQARAIRAVGDRQVEVAIAVSIGIDGSNTALALAAPR